MKIEKVYINNFRSLVDFKIEEFDSTTIFFGENNAGKSNILKALEFIFQRKVQYHNGDYTDPMNFHEGILQGFSNNFFNNDEKSIIDFTIDITIQKEELEIKEVLVPLFKRWPKKLKFSLKGKIVKSDLGNDVAEIKTDNIKVNGVSIYDTTSTTIKYFPSLGKQNNITGKLAEAFTHFINPLNDCIYIIGSGRNTQSTPFNESLLDTFKPDDLKKSLYSLYLSEKKHLIFEKINSVFNAEPFSFGSISFANINNELELMVKNNGVRLPIKHLGSGVEQILYIISSLVYTKKKIVCIEELEQNLSPKLQNLALMKIQTMAGDFFDQILISSHSSVFSDTELSKAIYLIKKKGSKTVVSEKLGDNIGKKMKDHFIDTALPYDTYSEEELVENIEEVRRMTEERFKM